MVRFLSHENKIWVFSEGRIVLNKFIRGVIDGSLSTLGIVIGASSASIPIILAAGLGGTVANSLSNFLGSFFAERSDKIETIERIETAMVTKEMEGSKLDQELEERTIKASLTDATATLIGGLLPIMPYLFLSIPDALILSTTLVILVVSIVGAYLGKKAKENIFLSVSKMVTFGVGIATAIYLLQKFIIP